MPVKFLFWPVKPFNINQYFGENQVCISTDGSKKILSCDGLNPPSGYKSLYGEKGHTGLDIAAYSGQNVYCAFEGTVYAIDNDPKSGLDVRIESEFNGEKFRHIYEHLLGHNNVKIGDKIRTGECIGWADNTGYSSGNHLHFGLYKFIKDQWIVVDPKLYLNSYFAPDINLVNSILERLAVVLEELVDKIRRK